MNKQCIICVILGHVLSEKIILVGMKELFAKKGQLNARVAIGYSIYSAPFNCGIHLGRGPVVRAVRVYGSIANPGCSCPRSCICLSREIRSHAMMATIAVNTQISSAAPNKIRYHNKTIRDDRSSTQNSPKES